MGQLGFRNGEEQREGEEASRRELSPFYSSRSPRHRGAHGFLLPRSINADGSQLCLPPAPADARRQVGEEESEAKQGRERMDNACRIRARSLNGLPRQRNSPPFLKARQEQQEVITAAVDGEGNLKKVLGKFTEGRWV